MPKFALIALAVAATMLPGAGQAAIIFTLDAPTQSAAAGQTVKFSGSLFNNGTTTVYLNGDQENATTGAAGFNDDAFFTDVPLFLAPNGSYVGDFFNVVLSSPETVAAVNGNYSITGGATADSQDIIASRNFVINVTAAAVPEPASLALLGLGFAGVIAARRRSGGTLTGC